MPTPDAGAFDGGDLPDEAVDAGLDPDLWVTLAEAEREAGVSRSALRSWYRSGELESRLLEGPHGPQRLVPLDAVLARAERSPRLRRRAERALALEAQVDLLQTRVEDLEGLVADLRRELRSLRDLRVGRQD